MKKSLNIVVLAIALLATQACGSKSEKNNEVISEAEVSAENKKVVLSVADRKIKIEQERVEREEKRRIEREKLTAITPTYTDAKGNLVYRKVESEPAFNGGNSAMMEYLRDNVKFPEDAREKEVEGTVFVDFVITKDGSVRDVEVTEATSEEVDQSFRNEAIRVVSSMPNWVPGRQQGKPVDVNFSIPITFELN